MIIFLVDWLKYTLNIKVPMVFTYYSTRMILAAITSLIISIFLGPYFIKKLYELKIGQTIRVEDCPLLGQLHEKKKDTPTMGGVLILFSMLISMFLWMDISHVFTLILFITTVWLGVVGGYDDYLKLKHKNPKGLSGKKKLLYQFTLSAFIALYLLCPSVSTSIQMKNWFAPPIVKEQTATKTKWGPLVMKQEATNSSGPTAISLKDYATRIYLPFIKNHWLVLKGALTLVAALFIMFVITGSSNAANLTDGLDGLAAGCLIIVAGCLALIAFVSNHIQIAGYLNILYIEGSGEIAIYLSALIGACLGFLWYNSHPAQVFMGDTGSLALGGIIGVSAVLLKRELLLGLVGGIFVAEALSVILQVLSYKYRNKKRIFLCAPLHHHFEYMGWAETKVVTRFWIIGLLLGILGIASLKFQ
ncbi:phospho-N-acetylmuramoyl-pentapeptide-transferase [Neochlamydia sp. S13]|uniref:phospho-N-acetylmuramoyl-pentapeptide- transferase n=1 Tax=Neochlamydia sp. S13 TaxID=1353976 RepID=UPI0005A8E9AD|nr:phospho-N-acetylmuramoyl-pentapeptide-transferase [Neochlamydia sp. S13]BBI18212.1 phospho-N-acetylmuramoyl-pentapeptide-transferase mraY [Neochlamydia sp. S13]